MKTSDPGHVASRRAFLSRGALVGGTIAPAALAGSCPRRPPPPRTRRPPPRGPFDVRDFGAVRSRRARSRSASATREPGRALFKRDLPAVLALHTDRLTVRNLAVGWADDVPAYFTHAIEAEALGELVVDGFRGRQAPRAGAAIRLARGEDFVVRDSRAAAGTDVFVEVTVTGRRLLAGNDVRSARRAARPASLGRPEAPATGRGGTAQDR